MTQGSVTAILKTEDVAGTIEWYRRVGFEIRGVREWGTRELGLQDPNGYFLTFAEPA